MFGVYSGATLTHPEAPDDFFQTPFPQPSDEFKEPVSTSAPCTDLSCYEERDAYEVTEEWRKLHNEELNDLYSSPNIVRVINRLNPSGFFTYQKVLHSKILRGARFALSVLRGYKNR